MRYLELDRDKYDRRVRRIADKPNAAMLKSNKLLYEIMRDHRNRQLREWELGKPVAYAQSGPSMRILMAMGINPFQMARLADSLRPDQSMKYFALSRDTGFPADACDWVQTATGLALSGDIPEPNLVFTEYNDCGIVVQWALWMGRHFKVPTFAIDVPMEIDHDGLAYVVKQLEEMVAEIERVIPGVRYDEDKHKALLQQDRDCQTYIDSILQLLKRVPLPIASKDAMRMISTEVDDARILEYYRQLCEEITERVEKSDPPVPDEQGRLMWLAAIPNFCDPFSFLEGRKFTSPVFEEGVGMRKYRKLADELEEKRGSKLTPLEEEAAAMDVHWSGPAEKRVGEIVEACREFKIDGLVHVMMPGCRTCVGSAQIIAERARQELGIPTLMTEGWIQDFEKFDEAGFLAKLGAFTELISQRKRGGQGS